MMPCFQQINRSTAVCGWLSRVGCVFAGNIWVHLALLLACMSTVAIGSVAPWPLAGTALFSLLLPVMLCLAGSVTYHTLMANHWNYKTYITIDVST